MKGEIDMLNKIVKLIKQQKCIAKPYPTAYECVTFSYD